MTRLPVPGSDDGSWGDILNTFLTVEHNTNGALKIRTDGTLSAYAQDASVVHLAGAETVTGVKTFSVSPLVPAPTTSGQAASKDYVDGIASSGAPDATTSTNGLIRLAGDLGGSGTAAATPVISSGAITTTKIASGAVTTAQIASGTIVNANISASAAIAKSKLAALNITDSDIAAGAAIAESKISGLTTDLSGKLTTSNNLSELSGTAETARINLGLGTSATLNVGTGTSTVAAGNDTRITGAVQSSTVTAKGDILAATASGTVTNLAVGSDGQVLTADSTQAAGVKWAPASGGGGGGVATVNGSSLTIAIAPEVFTLTDATTIAVDASKGNHFRVTLSGNRTLGLPTNPTDAQRIMFEVIQDATGARTLSYAAGYAFSSGIPLPTLTTTAAKRDLIGFVYNATTSLWYCMAFVNGF